MSSSLLLSLLIHGLLLSLTFGGHGLGLPGLGFPWQERRVDVPELRVVLVPARVAPAVAAVNSVTAPTQQVSIESPVAGDLARTAPTSPAPLRGRGLEILPAATPKAEAKLERNEVAPAAPAKASTRGDSRRAVPAKIRKSSAIDVPPAKPKLVVPPLPKGPDVIAAAPSVLSPDTVMPAHPDPGDPTPERIGPDVQERAAELAEQADQLEAARVEAAKRDADLREEAARVEAARVKAKREEAAQLAAARLEAQRQEATRQEIAARIEAAQRAAAQLEAERLLATRREAARVEAARAAQLDAERQEATRREAAARIEAARRAAAELELERRPAVRQEAAPVEAARTAPPEAQPQEPARQEKARPEAVRPETERRELARPEGKHEEPARQAATPREVARGEAEKDEEERREARRRAIGRQLDEEAARRQAASNARQLPLSLSTARRARLWGRVDPNVELVQYAEGWARKIQFNTPVATVREVAKQPHRQPMVTVSIRSDGSVESVTFVIPSGVAQVDDAIRRIVHSHEHYPPFPPALAREYDVIEIRRTWHFDDAVRLH
ncbi:MAG TPA: TonB C-terminal domain-containing protein [Burkholderiaceae bacterium]|nr:TonB C-terminal domain-containing protein [Burkholderiaceae bacterium]